MKIRKEKSLKEFHFLKQNVVSMAVRWLNYLNNSSRHRHSHASFSPVKTNCEVYHTINYNHRCLI